MKKNYLLILAMFLFVSLESYSQILTFEFNGLSGNETTATSGTNDSNISSSTISRGSGLTASTNGNRFNATSWNTGTVTDAISGNDYMEFTITPNSGFQFSVTSIDVNVQRSGTGPRAISLRSSEDGYASNLDAEKSISDNTSTQTFTFTFSQTSSSAVTYRFYLHSAEGTGGSGGFEGTGDDISVNGSTSATSSDPSVSFDSAASSETETDATFATSGIAVTLSNYDADVTITPSVNGSSTAEAGDYTIDLTPLVFDANETLTIPLSINDDADFDNETIIIDIAVTSGTANLGTSQHTVTITDDETPNIIINEILYDPGPDTSGSSNGDSNGDGSRSATDDEFVEIVNTETSSVDISGYTIEENSGVVHTFAASTVLPAGGSIVVFGGGTPTSIPGLSVTASSGSLGLGNSGETVTLKNSGGITIDSHSYSGASDQSTARNIDLTGSFIGHNSITSNPENFSPGRYNASNISFEINTWKGTTDNDWDTGSNWSTGSAPGGSDDAQILAGITNYPTASGTVTLNSLTINSGATFRISNTFTGSITYKRNLTNGSQWYLMSSPVTGEMYDDTWVSNNSVASGTNSNIGIGTWNNTSSDIDTDGGGTDTATGHWRYFQSGGGATSFNVGQGYAIIRSSSGDISFEGTGLYTSSQTFGITQGASNNFNFVGNPFTAYLNLGDFFVDNPATTVLESALTAWFWNGSSYDARTSGLNPTYEIAPGQGFFVEAASDTNLTFDIADTNHLADTAEGSDTFQRDTTRPEINLFVSNGEESRYTNVYYIDGTTTGKDSGYDAKLFGGVEYSFAMYTNLLSDNVGEKYQLQSLPNENFGNMIIPVGIISDPGPLTFTADVFDLPTDYMVFIEDKDTGSITRLDEEGSEYTVTLDSALNDIGRFYLHMNTSALSNDEFTLDNISIYTSDSNTLRIVGLQSGSAQVSMYNILGAQVLKTSFSGNGLNEIMLPELRTGVYIVQLETKTGKLNKKVIIE